MDPEKFNVHLRWFGDPPPDPPPGGPPKPGDSVPVAYASQLSPEQRKDERLMGALKAHPKMSDLVHSWDEGQQRLARAIVVPNAQKPDAAEMKTFREAMGLPDKPEDYPLNTAAYKDVQGMEEIVKVVRERALDMSLSKTQAQKLLDTLMGMSNAGRDQVLKARKESAESFDARLLEAVGKEEAKATAAKNLLRSHMIRLGTNAEKLGKGKGEALMRKIADSGLLYDPTFALVTAEIASMLGEEKMVKGGGGAGEAAPKPQGGQGHYSPEFQATFGKRPQKGA